MLNTVPPPLLQDLQRRYAEPQRHYHDWNHVTALLGHFEGIQGDIADRSAVFYAILFHDAVYDPQAKDNEAASAALLLTSAPAIPPHSLALAHRMILATDGHNLPDDMGKEELMDTARFLDMDLAILGAGRERFDIYEQQIRREYAHVPPDAYRAGRAAVLRHFAQRTNLYFSEWGQHRFEAKARANLRRSLAALEV